MTYYYADSTGQHVGPFTLDALQQMRASGMIHDSTPVIGEGGSAWSTYAALFSSHSGSSVASRPPASPPAKHSGLAYLFWLLLLVGAAIFGFVTHDQFPFTAWLAGLGTFFVLVPIGWGLGSLFRRFTKPDLLFAASPGELFKAKVYWIVGPQCVGAVVAVSAAYFLAKGLSEIPRETKSASETVAAAENATPMDRSSPAETTGTKRTTVNTPEHLVATAQPEARQSIASPQLPGNRSARLTANEIRSWNLARVRYAINEIYAHYGTEFPNRDIQAWADRQAWYHRIPGRTAEAADQYLSSDDRFNIELLAARRNALRSR